MAWIFRRVVRGIWWCAVIILVLGFPLLVWGLNSAHKSSTFQAWFYAGVFVVMTLPVTLYEVAMHLEYFTSPFLQKYVIRIHWLVPIYAVDAWLALQFIQAEVYLNPLRECYEAFTIYNFYSYLVAFLESEVGDIGTHMMLKPPLEHLTPFSLVCKRWVMGDEFLWECKKGILNFVILRPITAVMVMIAEASSTYHQGRFYPDNMWFWVTMINNISQIWAVYCLVMFYRATHRELEPIRPVPKFLLIKAIVFLTFWQSAVISIVNNLGWLKMEHLSPDEQDSFGTRLQNFIICIEMFIASLVFAYVFPPKDYMDPMVTTRGFFGNVVHLFDVRDVMDDVTSGLKAVVGDRVDRTTVGVADVTSSFVHNLSSFFKNPAKFIRGRRWQRSSRASNLTDQTDPLLRMYSAVDWSIPLPQDLNPAQKNAQTDETELKPKERLPGYPEDQEDDMK